MSKRLARRKYRPVRQEKGSPVDEEPEKKEVEMPKFSLHACTSRHVRYPSRDECIDTPGKPERYAQIPALSDMS